MKIIFLLFVVFLAVYKQMAKKIEAPEESPLEPDTMDNADEEISLSDVSPAMIQEKLKLLNQIAKTKETEAAKTANAAKPTATAPEVCDSDYSICSAEDARKAIIWSEIMTRKY